MRRRTSSRDLVISANVGTARSITDTVYFGKRWVYNEITSSHFIIDEHFTEGSSQSSHCGQAACNLLKKCSENELKCVFVFLD